MKKTKNEPGKFYEAKNIQLELSKKVKLTAFDNDLVFIAGVDAAFKDNKVIGSACLYKKTNDDGSTFTLEKIDEKVSIMDVEFPYVPGFLSFREAPVLMESIGKLIKIPDIILVDGQGIAHPRRLGIASHIGVTLDIPTVGVAKSRLIGIHKDPGINRGDWQYLMDNNGDTIGVILRTKKGIKPLYISPGHLINIEDSKEIALKCSHKYRLPEPIRCAHLISGNFKLTIIPK
ncbi:MAG: endonuclease V [Candidatus Magnetoovum sp. WYHC-5]|nr:endonuclease V [Candidatus Magnetoovum sp. WYHC-5]